MKENPVRDQRESGKDVKFIFLTFFQTIFLGQHSSSGVGEM
jgi:hypothetical protein